MECSTIQSIYLHERPITELKFHKDGDVFFASSKDTTASMVNLSGKILGSFNNHTGAISTLDSNENTLITSGLDLSLLKWDILTGSCTSSIPSESVVRGLDFCDQVYFCTDDSMKKDSFIGIYDVRTNTATKMIDSHDPLFKIFKYQDYLIAASVDGNIYKFDIRANKIIQEAKIHNSKICNMKPSFCRSFFITASSDATSKIIDSETFAIKKVFNTEDPINSACIFNSNDKVICAGGINARDVTTTKGKGLFDTDFFDIVSQNKIGSFNTHFGTINSLDVHPQGTHYISGGEDGSICLVKLGQDFYQAPFTNFN